MVVAKRLLSALLETGVELWILKAGYQRRRVGVSRSQRHELSSG